MLVVVKILYFFFFKFFFCQKIRAKVDLQIYKFWHWPYEPSKDMDPNMRSFDTGLRAGGTVLGGDTWQM